ncbi:SPX domain-containing protein [Pilobolus umbonatus]|nr:SPX domain-containing protein [Pilobolus umbonatus]
MKFAKQLETEAEDIPCEWRPYLIQYKTLKKMITKVAEEIESRGLTASLLHECLGEVDEEENSHCTSRIKYYFTGKEYREPPHIKPNIEFTYDPHNPRIQKAVEQLIEQESRNEEDRPKLEYKRTHDNKDFFSVSNKSLENVTPDYVTTKTHSTVLLVKELLLMTLEAKRHMVEDHIDDATPLKSIVIELEQDDEFFKTLLKELDQAVDLQSLTSKKLQNDICQLESSMCKVASPTNKKDMYNWRKIFALYMDAQIFQGNAESDRTFRSVERSKKQMTWFMNQVVKMNTLVKLKTKESKSTFEHFIALNNELIRMRHYQMLNQTAIRKILKKHDKRSGLNASHNFGEIISTDLLFSPKLAIMVYATITDKLTTIIPQPEDYACPVCMCVAWRPIRLSCSHVFCVRCLIKAQRKGMNSCPMCRHPTAIKKATAYNLDEGLQNFLKMYFPLEIKAKKKDNEREQAIEDIQAMTGKRFSEEQLMKMSQQQDAKCIIM